VILDPTPSTQRGRILLERVGDISLERGSAVDRCVIHASCSPRYHRRDMTRLLKGTITKINRPHQWGEIQGDDGSVRRFEHESMARWMQFDELEPGTRVIFEVEGAGAVINVERIG